MTAEPVAKVFCLSFQKVGTTSLHEFLISSGLSSCHGPHRVGGVDYMEKVGAVADDPARVADVLKPVIERFDAHCDVPWPGLYEVLAGRYRDARFVLMRRDPQDWWDSISAHWSLRLFDHALTPFEYVQYRPYLGNGKRVVSLRDKARLQDAFAVHLEEVPRRLAGHQLLVLDLQDDAKAAKLADFLGLAAAGSYPHSKKSDFARKGRRMFKNIKRRLVAHG
jgi:hypothetical protein